MTPPIGLPGCCAPCLASLSACSLPKSPEWALAQWYWTGRPMSLSHHLAVSSAFWTVRAGGLADVALMTASRLSQTTMGLLSVGALQADACRRASLIALTSISMVDAVGV